MLEKREDDPSVGFVQLQIARVGEATVVAHTMMMQGDLQAMDRLMKLNGELDRYHGFGRAQLAAPAEAAPPRLVPSPRALLEASSAANGGQGKFSSPQSLEKSGNQKIHGPAPLRQEAGRGMAPSIRQHVLRLHGRIRL